MIKFERIIIGKIGAWPIFFKCSFNGHVIIMPKNTPPTCSHCGEVHPAIYRDRVVAGEMQNRRQITIQSYKQATLTKANILPNIKSYVSYAQKLSKSNR